MDTTLESEETGNKATVIFNAHETSGGMVNNVNGNLTIGDRTHIEYANIYITNTVLATEIYPTRSPPNEADTNTIVAPFHSVRRSQHPGTFKPLANHIDGGGNIQACRPPDSADRSLIEIQVITGIMDELIKNPSLRHSANLPETLASLKRILQLTKLAFRVYQHGPLAKTLSLIIIAEAAHWRQLLMELLNSLGNYRHALSAAMLHFIREYIWSRAGECTALSDLNSRLRERHSYFAACILALGSVASAELEWGTGTGDLAELRQFSVLFEQESTSLQHIRIDTVIVVDHLARHLPVPTIFCQSWQDFHVVITGFCKDWAGGMLIQRGDYRILSSDEEEYINPTEISTVLQPGMTVEMCIVLREPVEERYGSEEHRCPRCDHVNRKVITDSGWVACRSCNGRFEISPEDESVVSPAVERHAHENDLPDERSLFRRISILQDDRRKEEATEAQDEKALEAAKNENQETPAKISAAFDEVSGALLKEPDLKPKAEVIQKNQDSAQENDVKAQAQSVPTMKQHEIKQENPPGQDVELQQYIGASWLTGYQERIATGNPSREIIRAIDSAFSFKKSRRGIYDVGSDYFSQAIEVISFCHKINIKNRPDLVPKRNEMYLAAQDALEAARNNKKPKLSPGEINTAFEKVWDLLKEPDLNLKVEEIERKQKDARENDVKTQARLLPSRKQHEIKLANPPGKEVELHLYLGARQLTGPPEWIPTEPFGNNQTLNTVLWLLIQSGKVRMDQNPHFYSSGLLESATSFDHQFKTDPLSFDEKLKRSKDVRVLHILVDESYRLVLQSQDLSFYRNFGNIWSTGQLSEPVRIVKHLNGTLEATNLIDSHISESRLALRPISGSAGTSQAGEHMWGDYLMSVSRGAIGQVTFEYEELPADNCGEEISGEDTEPEEREDLSEDDVQEEQIQVAPQRQTRAQKAKEIQVAAMKADEQASSKEEARPGVEAEKEEREARAAREARRRNEAERRDREAQDEKRRIKDQQRKNAKKRAKAAQERSDSEKRNREAEEAEEAARVKREQQEAAIERQQEPRQGWVRRQWNFGAGK